jgi:hypothetical protein
LAGLGWILPDLAQFGFGLDSLRAPASPYDCLDDVVYTYESLRRKAANMTLSIRDAATDQLVRELAKRKNLGLTEAVHLQRGDERFLRDVDLAELAHLLLAGLLLVEQLALAGGVAAVALWR